MEPTRFLKRGEGTRGSAVWASRRGGRRIWHVIRVNRMAKGRNRLSASP